MSKLSRYWLPIAAIMLLTACGTAAPTRAAVQQLTVTANEFSFGSNALEVSKGQPVEITFENKGTVEHDFSIRDIDLAEQPTATGDTHMSGGHMMADQPKVHVAAAAGSRGTLTFTPTKPGQYEFYCTVAGHKEAGMVGVLTVKGS
jgi:uncharacterized cupredoxin-like copper-binding protein